MFNWLGNLFPYSDLHSLNLDWILNKMKETAAQAAQAIADSANALAQVAEAKAAALSAQTAAEDAQTAAGQASGNAASAAANAVQALNAAQTARETATAANNKAQTAQETATAANNKAQTAQETATAANGAAQSAQETANNTANKFPVNTADIADNAVTYSKLKSNSVSTSQISNLAKFKTEWKTATNFAEVNKTATRFAISVDRDIKGRIGEINVMPVDSKYIPIYNRPFFASVADSTRITDLTIFNTATNVKTHYWLAYEYDNGYYILIYKDGDMSTVEDLPFTLKIRVDVYQSLIDK